MTALYVYISISVGNGANCGQNIKFEYKEPTTKMNMAHDSFNDI